MTKTYEIAKIMYPNRVTQDYIHPITKIIIELIDEYIDQKYTLDALKKGGTEQVVTCLVEGLNKMSKKLGMENLRNDLNTPELQKSVFMEEILPKFYEVTSGKIEQLTKVYPESKIALISLGCGNGTTEEWLYKEIKNKKPNLLNHTIWIGLDSVKPKPDSFYASDFTQFVHTNLENLYETDSNFSKYQQRIYFALFMAHHTDFTPASFQKAFSEAQSIVMFEELMHPLEKTESIARLIHIAKDVVANWKTNPQWADYFLKYPVAFHINYWKREDLNSNYWNILEFKNSMVQILVLGNNG